MDLSATFKTEVYRPVVTIVIPGAIALAPLGYFLGVTQPDWLAFAEGHALLTSVTFLLAAIALGFLFEDIGSHVENGPWERVQGGCEQSEREWYSYLRLAPDPEPIGLKFIATIVTRLKFELSTSLALMVCLIELIWLRCGGIAKVPGSLFLILSLVCAGLLRESYLSCKLLRRLRHAMLTPPMIEPGP